MKLFHLPLVLIAITLLSCSKDIAGIATQLQINVVAISADNENGFGFITGQRANEVYIVTADHLTINKKLIEVQFQNQSNKVEAEVIFRSYDPDLALLKVMNPPRVNWFKNCMGTFKVEDEVGFIGRNGEWYIPKKQALGYIESKQLNQINCFLPTVEFGSSGAPLIHSTGIIGMIVENAQQNATALDLAVIKSVLQSEQDYWFQLELSGLRSGRTETYSDTLKIFEEVESYIAVQELDDEYEYEVFIETYPESRFRKQVEKRLLELKELRSLKAEIAFSKDKTIIVINDQEGNTYPTKLMDDGKRWMIKNLNVELPDSWCFKEDSLNCEIYGRLYTWEAAVKGCELLGDGWRLPSDKEWNELAMAYGGLKVNDSDWVDINNPRESYNALLENGEGNFYAKLGGERHYYGFFDVLGVFGHYWSSTSNEPDGAIRYTFNGHPGFGNIRDNDFYGKLIRASFEKKYALSVRCIQD
ncbi:MAG: FISUMP domain-containing protein [Bacteroidota bacterium]